MYGKCTNNDGGYDCKCPEHFDTLPGGNGCVDKRKGACYMDFREGFFKPLNTKAHKFVAYFSANQSSS